MAEVRIVDTTLRDGEQTAGVSFLKDQKINIAKNLDAIGVHIIEVGIPAMGKEEMNRIIEINKLDLKAQLLTWNRMVKEDIDCSLQCGVKNLHLSMPTSNIQITNKFNKDRQWMINKTKEVIRYAIDKGCNVSVGAEDASRTELTDLIDFYYIAQAEGANRVRYADTLGILNPIKTYEIIKEIKKGISLDLDFHGHNDFGMATANALCAFKGGASHISCSVNGLGERAGNTALEEIVAALELIEHTSTHIDLKKLTGLSEMVQEASKRYNSDSKPIVGKSVFSHESGIHIDGLLKDSQNYEAFPPEVLGRQRDFVAGKFSGSSSIIYKYEQLGVSIDEEQARDILGVLREMYDSNHNIDETFWTDEMKRFL